MLKVFSHLFGKSENKSPHVDGEDLFVASFVLSAVGDALGYKSGSWEFCKNGLAILEEANQLGGVMKIQLKTPEWPLSDDTIMHIATARALLSSWFTVHEFSVSLKEKLYPEICKEYVACWKDMGGRSPGIQCMKAMPTLRSGHWNGVEFSGMGGGCGAAMRTMCIGLMLNKPDPQSLDLLVKIAIESGRMTHNHPTGFLGGVVAALFTAYAVQRVPVELWGYKLVHEVLPLCYEYLQKEHRNWDDYNQGSNLKYFEEAWVKYLTLRKINTGQPGEKAVFPEPFGFEERDKYYKAISFSGWGGSSGHDSVIIAYDALLGSNGSWEEFCNRGIIHGGDNDSTGAIGGAWFGALYGFQGVPPCHYNTLEYLDDLHDLAKNLCTRTAEFYQAKDANESTNHHQNQPSDNNNNTTEPTNTNATQTENDTHTHK